MRNGRGNHNAGFQLHHTNTQAPPKQQAGTAFSVQPLATRDINSLLNNLRIFIMSNANQNNANRNLSQPQDGREQFDAAAASMNSFPGGFHAIATAYSDYTKKSFEDTRAFVEELSGAKSVDKAIEIQTEFAKSAFERSWPSRRRLARCIAILPRSPTNHSVICSPNDPDKSISHIPRDVSAKMALLIAGFFTAADGPRTKLASYVPLFSTDSIRCGLCARPQ